MLPDSDPGPNLAVTKADGTVLVENTDYTLVRGSGPAGATTVARKTSSTAIQPGDTVYVSYAYTDAQYYIPKQFSDYTSIEATYGAAMVSVAPAASTDTQVASPLSLATRLAFENGASSVICLPVEPVITQHTLRDRFAEAYAKLANDYSTSILVPVFTNAGGLNASAYTSGLAGFASDVKAHVESQASQGYGRLAIIGPDTIYDESAQGVNVLAAGVRSSREMIAYPTRMNYFNNALGQTTEVGGSFLAAAMAGLLASQPVNRGVTQQAVSGFTGIPSDIKQKMTKDFKDLLSSSGVAVVQNERSGSLRIRHGVTTNPGDLVTAEVSITRQSDVLYQMIYDGVQAADLIGDPIDSEMTVRIKGIITGILETAKAQNVIRDWPSLVVRQQSLPSGDPTAVECIFTWQPFLPVNFIIVAFSMDLTTGDIVPDDSLIAA